MSTSDNHIGTKIMQERADGYAEGLRAAANALRMEYNISSVLVNGLEVFGADAGTPAACYQAILALIPVDPAQVKTQEWAWWAGQTEEFYTVGPCESKNEAINEAISDGIGEWLDYSQNPPVWMQSFNVIEATHDPLRLADWINTDTILERAEDALADSDRVSCEHDDGPCFAVTIKQESDLIQRVKTACDEWQAAHVLVFKSTTFSRHRNCEVITRAIAEENL